MSVGCRQVVRYPARAGHSGAKIQKMFYVYVLKSQKDQGFYIGQTNHLEKRIVRHNAGQVRSTKGRIPFEIHYFEHFETRAEAMRRESYLKSLKGGQTFQKIIDH